LQKHRPITTRRVEVGQTLKVAFDGSSNLLALLFIPNKRNIATTAANAAENFRWRRGFQRTLSCSG
jgi:hypothetical protein